MSTSMTKGNPLKLMLQFAFPLLIGNLLQQTYNIIDAAIVGQILGAKALASVGASSSIQFLVLGFCMGSCTGFGVPVAKYFGAEKMDTMRNYVFNGAVLTGGIGVTVTILCSVFCPQILHLLSVPEDIFRGAYHYLLIIFLGIPFTLLYNYLSSILRSLGDSRTPFLFLAFSAILNIFLDLFCIVVLKWGCAGAAAATITAQAISGILCLVFIGRKMNVLNLTKENRMVSITAVKELLAMGLPTGLQFSITAIGSMVMQSANNGLGSVCVSGFTAGICILQPEYGRKAAGTDQEGTAAGSRDCNDIWTADWAGADLRRTHAVDDLCEKISSGCLGCIRKISAVSWIFLLESRYPECEPYGDTGTWIFRKSSTFRCDGDAGKNDCQSGICRSPGVYGNLLRGSGGMDRSMLLHSTDLPALRQKGDGDTGR